MAQTYVVTIQTRDDSFGDSPYVAVVDADSEEQACERAQASVDYLDGVDEEDLNFGVNLLSEVRIAPDAAPATS